MANTIWTIGHSTRTIDEFVTALKAYDIELLVDVRRFPGSRRLPQFGSDELRAALVSNGIAYLWLESLGGRRSVRKDSRNFAWTNSAFRGYADHVETEEFAEGLFELLNVSCGLRTAVMCAEVLWWRCHRRIISDVLVSLGYDVIHIRDEKVSEAHRISAPGRIVEGALSYEPDVVQYGLGIE
jgi:uncharacterized protein (DUF488 family)